MGLLFINQPCDSAHTIALTCRITFRWFLFTYLLQLSRWDASGKAVVRGFHDNCYGTELSTPVLQTVSRDSTLFFSHPQFISDKRQEKFSFYAQWGKGYSSGSTKLMHQSDEERLAGGELIASALPIQWLPEIASSNHVVSMLPLNT